MRASNSFLFLGCFVDLGQVLEELSRHQQIGVQHRPVLFQIPFPHTPVFADRQPIGILRDKIGKKNVADLRIRAAAALIERLLHFSNLHAIIFRVVGLK